MLTPFGGIRRGTLDIYVGGVLFSPDEVTVDVYVGGLNTPDATLTAAATASVAERATGLYTYEYSVAGIAAATQIRELIKTRQTEDDDLVPVAQKMTVIAALAEASGLTADQMCIKLVQSAGCC